MRARAGIWVALYVLLSIAPLAFSFVQLDPGRGFWVNLSIAAGFVGLSMMGLQFALAAHSVRTGRAIGLSVLLGFHRQITVIIAVLIFAHPIILFIWDPRFLSLLNPVTAPVRAQFAVTSVLLLTLLIVTSVWRRAFRIRYAIWQVLHSVLAVAIVIFAMLHVLLIGYYIDEPWERALWAVYTLAFVWIGIWVRLIRPILRWRRRFRVIAVESDTADATRLTLVPVNPHAFPGGAFRFRPGQYAWIHVGRFPFAMTYHPFSFSSSAERRDSVEFTIKSEQNFTAHVPDLVPGSVVYLDGPWGHLSIDEIDAPGVVLIGAGVGVTPLLSTIETMADRDDQRPVWLVLGNRHETEIIGSARIVELASRMPNLRVVHVISRPGAGWAGERGHLSAEVLDRHLPPNRAELAYLICASDAVMDASLGALSTLGVPERRILAERFAMA